MLRPSNRDMKKPASKKTRSPGASQQNSSTREVSPIPAGNKASRAELETRLEKYRELYDFSPAGYFTLNRDGVICELNLSGALLVGMERSVLVNRPFSEFISANEQAGFNSFIQKLFEYNVKTSCELPLYNDYNPGQYVHIDGMVVEMGTKCLLVVTDITGRIKAEEENGKLAMIANLTTNAITLVSSTGYIEWANKGFEQLSGYPLAELVGENLFAFFNGPDTLPSTIKTLEASLQTKSGCKIESIRYNKSRQPYWVDIEMIPVINSYNMVTGYMVTETDITNRKKEESNLLVLNQRLKQKATELVISNEELESFAYVTSHDLQEPLRMVSGFMRLLKKNYEPALDEKANQYIQFAVNGADRMKQLIIDLLDYSRVGTSKDSFEEVNMNEIVGEVISLFDKTDEQEHLKPLIRYLSLPTVYASKMQMAQLMQNLLGNAIKYRRDERPEIDIRYREEAGQFIFSISDNGIGIEAKNVEKIFTLFQRLHIKEEFPGTGIGLATCKKIIDRHGGSIWVESKPGEGSTFFFTIKNVLPDLQKIS